MSNTSSAPSSASSNKVYPLLASTNIPMDDVLDSSRDHLIRTKNRKNSRNDRKELEIEHDEDYVITWTHVKYLVEFSYFYRLLGKLMGQAEMPSRKLVLKGVSGQLHSGHLMAIMGPSGAGKSTLMESVVGIRQVGVSGGINCSSRRQLRLAFIPQHDEFFGQLTVRECLMFASKVHYRTAAYQSGNTKAISSKQFHTNAVNDVLNALQLTICADNQINKCSGGQQKRLSIGQELLGSPDVLVLDEPTSGLDSAACILVIRLLKDLTTVKNMSILLTIHQPSTKVFNMFDNIYMLSKHGKCIYDGHPLDVLETLSSRGLECPDNYNPGEFLIDVASEEFGLSSMMALATHQERQFQADTLDENPGRLLKDVIRHGDFPISGHFGEIVKRSVKVTFRDKWLFGLRFFAHTAFALVIALQLGTKLGPRGGCPPDFDENFDPVELEAIQIHNKLETDAVFDNAGAIFMQMIIIIFTSVLPTVLTFPYEMRIFVKEVKNGWYSIGTYYLGKSAADIPFQLLFPSMFAGIFYFGTNQASGTIWRFLIYALIVVFVSLAGQSHGLLVGAIFMRHVTAGVYLAPMTMIPLVLFGGFFMKVSSMHPIFAAVAALSYAKYAQEATLGAIYGFQRCGENAEKNMALARQSMSDWFSDMLGATDGRTGITDNFVDNMVKSVAGDFLSDDGRVRSIILNHYDVSDSDILPAILIIVITAVILRVVTYFVVLRRANAKI